MVRSTTWYQAYERTQWQQRISTNLGLKVQFERISFPAPDRFRVQKLVCNHPETGKEIARIATVDAWMDKTGWTIDLASPEINGEQVSDATKVFHDWFLCRPQQSASLLKLNVSQLSIYNGERHTNLQNVEIGLKPTKDTSTLWLRFSIEDQPFSEKAFLTVERQHALLKPRTKWLFQTNGAAIPCDLLADRMPAFGHLGRQALFKGKLEWNEIDSQGFAEIRGSFLSVDLAVATSSMNSPVRGIANLTVDRAVFRDEQLQFAQGMVESHQGTTSIDPSWINHAVQRLNLLVAAPAQTAASMVNAVRLKFQLTPNGLGLNGLSQAEGSMIAIVNGIPIFGTQLDKPISMSSLRTWLQSQALAVSEETIAKHLPWPSAHPGMSTEQQSPRIATDRR